MDSVLGLTARNSDVHMLVYRLISKYPEFCTMKCTFRDFVRYAGQLEKLFASDVQLRRGDRKEKNVYTLGLCAGVQRCIQRRGPNWETVWLTLAVAIFIVVCWRPWLFSISVIRPWRIIGPLNDACQAPYKSVHSRIWNADCDEIYTYPKLFTITW